MAPIIEVILQYRQGIYPQILESEVPREVNGIFKGARQQIPVDVVMKFEFCRTGRLQSD
jgi:hypothetical protein